MTSLLATSLVAAPAWAQDEATAVVAEAAPTEAPAAENKILQTFN